VAWEYEVDFIWGLWYNHVMTKVYTTTQKAGLWSTLGVGALMILGGAGVFVAMNCSNEKVDGGYAAYVYTNPIFGIKEFRSVIKGPGGTGYVWRQKSIPICVTPYTMTENFDDIFQDNLRNKLTIENGNYNIKDVLPVCQWEEERCR
jgi:hypothetical protein